MNEILGLEFKQAYIGIFRFGPYLFSPQFTQDYIHRSMTIPFPTRTLQIVRTLLSLEIQFLIQIIPEVRQYSVMKMLGGLYYLSLD